MKNFSLATVSVKYLNLRIVKKSADLGKMQEQGRVARNGIVKSQNEDLGKIAEETLAGFSRFSLFLSGIEDLGTGWIGKAIPIRFLI